MPRNDNVDPLPCAETRHLDEVPRTTFEDLEDAKRVTVLSRPEDSPLESYMTFARTCHNPEPVVSVGGDDWDLVARSAGSGRLLGQDSELYYWTLRLEGLTRVLSHQLVRARIGWTFSETCTGDQDWRHGSFLIPRPWMRNEYLLETHIGQMLRSKLLYAADLDGRLGCIGDDNGLFSPLAQCDALPDKFAQGATLDARYGLHPNLKVYVHAKVNLAALRVWYAARSCTMTQAYEMVVLAERVREAVIAASPWAAKSFVRPCDSGQCWWHKNRGLGVMMTNYYKPDAVHDTFDWHPASWLYGRTPQEMNSGPVPFETRRYVGADRVA